MTTMPPAASNEYRDLEAAARAANGKSNMSTPGTNNTTAYHQSSYPPVIIHNNNMDGDGDRSSHYLDDHSRSSRASRSSKASKVLIKKAKRLFQVPHFLGGKSKGGAGHDEQDVILEYQDLKSAGTFDSTNNTGTVISSSSAAAAAAAAAEGPTSSCTHYAHPRSQKRMTEKWGKLKSQMNHTNPDQWMRDIETAKRAIEKGGDDSSIDDASREQLIKQAQNNFRSLMEFSIWHCLVAIALYVAVSVGCFSYWLQDWTIIDSVYFAVVTFTTIGYGDLFPDTRISRMFTCIWALSGVACLGIALGVLGSNLIEVAEEEQKKEKDKQKYEVINMFNGYHHPVRSAAAAHHHSNSNNSPHSLDDSTQWSDLGPQGAEDYYRTVTGYDNDDDSSDNEAEASKCCQCIRSPKTKRFALLFTSLLAILYLISLVEDWSIPATIYYGLITASTVGYGDLSPHTETGRLLAILFIPTAVGVMGTLLDAVANYIISTRQQNAQDFLKTKELTLRDLLVMDSDGDGTVTKAEFLEFMLVAMNQVDKDLLQHLNEHFERLDKDNSGTLDKGDLITMAKRKLDSEKSFRQRHVRFNN